MAGISAVCRSFHENTLRDSKKWWDEFWTNRACPHASKRHVQETWYDLVWNISYEHWEEVFDAIAPGRSMLECGCGSGKISLHFARRGYRCTLLDYSRQGIAVARNNFRALSLRVKMCETLDCMKFTEQGERGF